MAFEDRPLLSPTDMQFDLVSAIQEDISRSLVSWSPQHVYGHLDKTLLLEEMTWWEQKNLEVNGLAVEFCRELKANHQLIAPNPCLWGRWREKQVVSPEAKAAIAWDTLGRAMRSLPTGLKSWITKHWVGMCGTGKFKVLWGLEKTAACPHCGSFEDHLHVLQCCAVSATQEWERRVSALSTWMDMRLTDHSIKKAILMLLGGVCDPTLPSTQAISPVVQLASWHNRLSVTKASWKLSQELIALGFYMREQRNSAQHSDDNVQLRERHRTANEGIHSQFDMGPDDLP
ncbi:unnamed protein product [Cylindrotheca closterium]|uniref:Uncharacterized protein n=1 Tax=Cylindrotheca closterium TaxID=2856 RepID=A0AAD2G0F4_9STRA|nr:unnamed protein product [Cylindrotheca closterium]